MRFKLLIIFLFCASCSADNQSPQLLSKRISDASTPQLCSAYFMNRTTARGKLMIEAELAVRGQRDCPLGRYESRSLATFGSKAYARNKTFARTVGSFDYDCSDFSSGASAQKFFLSAGGPISDIHNLDADGDGLACEWGTEARKLATYTRRVIPTPSRPVFSKCYVGPRGGTYTITSSGARNYDGC